MTERRLLGMTLKQFRLATAGLPDDTEIVAHGGDGDFYETRIDWILPPSGVDWIDDEDGSTHHDDLPYTIALSLRQPINADLDMWERTEDHPMWQGPGE